MDAKLQKAIEERKKEAREKDIMTKACRIAKQLGWIISHGDDNYEFRLENDRFIIKMVKSGVYDPNSAGYSETIISYYSTVVFREFGYDIDLFIPGHWEKEFEVLNKRAVQKSQEKTKMDREEEDRRQAEADQKERQRWGL